MGTEQFDEEDYCFAIGYQSRMVSYRLKTVANVADIILSNKNCEVGIEDKILYMNCVK